MSIFVAAVAVVLLALNALNQGAPPTMEWAVIFLGFCALAVGFDFYSLIRRGYPRR